MSDSDRIYAPFTKAQVKALNKWQNSPYVHPFTCGGDHKGGHIILVATEHGWVCPRSYCRYTQNWAHACMAQPLPPRRYFRP